MTVVLQADETQLVIPDMGVTVRTLLSVAARGHAITGKRTWKVSYKNVVIGSVRVKTQWTT